MGKVVYLPIKKEKNLYLIDECFIVLAYNKNEAFEALKMTSFKVEDLNAKLLNRNQDIFIINTRDGESVLWKRQPKENELVKYKLKISQFIDMYLKEFAVPSLQDFLEDD